MERSNPDQVLNSTTATFQSQWPSVAIVSVTRNRCQPLICLLSQIRKLDYPKDCLDIFLVDAASSDDTVERVKLHFPEVRLMVTGQNLGIAAGFNTGIEEVLKSGTEYKYIWLLDSDAEIEEDTLKPLVGAAEREPSIAVIGSAVYEIHRRSQIVTAGLQIDWKTSNIAYHVPKQETDDGLFDVDVIPACSSLTRTDLYRKLGIWDRRFWLYWGDTEWCTRAVEHGYRICCQIKSKVWHRNWANIQPDFNFPYALHDRTRSALLFNFLYNPEQSLKGLRSLILRGYLKAAFENLTMRPNFGRAYQEGIQDFLNGDFSKKDFSSWSEEMGLKRIEDLCESLSGKVPRKCRGLLNQFPGASRQKEIKKAVLKFFPEAEWEELPVKQNPEGAVARDRLFGYLFHQVPQLLFYLFAGFKRKDIIITPISLPCLSNIGAARYTLLLDSSLRGVLRKNSIFRGLAGLLATVMKGFKVAYLDLPKIEKNRRTFQDASADYNQITKVTT